MNESLTDAEVAELTGLLETHRQRLLAIVRQRIAPQLAGRVGAEDVLSEVFLRAVKKWRAYRDGRKCSAYCWLYGLVRDQLIEIWRREVGKHRDVRRDMPWPDQSSFLLAEQLVHSGTSPSGAAQKSEEIARLMQMMDRLSTTDREILHLRHIEQFSYAEISGILGITENTATARYVRALKRITALWNEQDNQRGGGDARQP